MREPPPPAPRLVATGSRILSRYARLVHGYEVHHIERIPVDGPALLVFYHALMPLDVWIVGAAVQQAHRRTIRFLADRFLFRTPGLRSLVQATGAVPGNRRDAVDLLRQGRLVGVAPGGVREALAPRRLHYQLVWGQRCGFAHVAVEAQAPIIPIFTENVEELYRAPGVDSMIVKAFYERTRVPLVPIVGLGLAPFPVKLRSWVGTPIVPDQDEDPWQLRCRTQEALQRLISQHQHTGEHRILSALQMRVEKYRFSR